MIVYLVCYVEFDSGGGSLIDGLVIRGICHSKLEAENFLIKLI